ncbi:YdaS family helix-turn-helix protein [Breoghania sp. L-A4]|uniref:YdaS family helix-turn-helix protein n=1 Tax=Breoghania sp. L-A4 TaxID=2304600 RepID=UPI0013C2C5D9|nr:YdaS family helix-turn-helix protein [Breoghania sp. L-A4]
MTQHLNALKQFRSARGWSLSQIGHPLGVHRSTVKRWEDHRVPAERVLEIERLTGIARQMLRPDLYQSECEATTMQLLQIDLSNAPRNPTANAEGSA